MKFLIVDDGATWRKAVVDTLARLGFDDTTEAENGKAALDKMDSGIDFIITDWNMPIMNGLELVKRVRSNPAYRDVTIMMITTEYGADHFLAAFESGANMYIVKPCRPDVLEKKMREILH